MSHFTFDTAYIVAHLQNNANSRLKAAIGERLDWLCEFDHARSGFAHHERACSYYECCRAYGFPHDEVDYEWFTSDWAEQEPRSDFQRWDDLVKARWHAATKDDEIDVYVERENDEQTIWF